MINRACRVSIIVCSRNRAATLKKTLAALGRVAVPDDWDAELILVDNASADQTAAMVKRARLTNLSTRYVYEARRGLSRARNSGLAAARGEAILFTDDDVVPAVDWLVELAAPLLHDECDAGAGRIEMAEYLCRPWMSPFYRQWLASPGLDLADDVELFGANMGFHRRVLQKVPAFDPELGAGALGFGEDTLFSLQVAQAGFRIRFIEAASVVHHFEPARLRRSVWLDAACARGRLEAYLRHHWHHRDVKLPRLCRLWLASKLHVRRRLQPPGPMDAEGCSRWEISYVGGMAMCQQSLIEHQRSRNFELHGLSKRPTEGSQEPGTADRGPPGNPCSHGDAN